MFKRVIEKPGIATKQVLSGSSENRVDALSDTGGTQKNNRNYISIWIALIIMGALMLIGFGVVGYLYGGLRLETADLKLTQTKLEKAISEKAEAALSTIQRRRPDCYWTEPKHFEKVMCKPGYYMAGAELGMGMEQSQMQCCKL